MKKVSTLIILFFACIGCNKAYGQDYTLEACIKIALEQNATFRNSELGIASADHRIKEVKSALMPNVNLQGQFIYYQDLPAQYAPASAFGGPEGQYRKMTLNMEQTTSGTLQVSQNLYNQSVFTGLKAAKVVRETAALETRVAKENLVYNVTATYYSIQVLSDNLSRLQENITNLEKTVQINAILKENEIISKNVHNRMLINLENLKNQYENQKLLVDKNITSLKLLMGVDINTPIQIAVFNYDEVLVAPSEGDISRRPDLQLQQANIKLSQIDKKTIAAGYAPVLTNSFSFGYTGYYDKFAPFKQVNDDWVKSSYIVMTLRIPVFDGFQKHYQIKQKDIAIQQNMNRLNYMKLTADKEVDDARNNYAVNKNLLANNKSSLDLAESLFASAQTEYENGILSMTELLNAQNDLTNSRTNYSAALLNLKLAELSLKKSNGTLLEN